MKREITAVVLLLFLLGASLVNLSCFDTLTGRLEADLTAAKDAALAGDRRMALAAYGRAEERWFSAKSYSNVFLRHPEVDSTADALFEFKESLLEGRGEECLAAFDKVIFHLECLNGMEHVRLGSVF